MANDIVLTNPDTIAQPGGHYSHAVAANGFVFIAGQLRSHATAANSATRRSSNKHNRRLLMSPRL